VRRNSSADAVETAEDSGDGAAFPEERALTRRVASWDSPLSRRVLPAAGWAAEHTRLWWAAAAVMVKMGGTRGRRAAVSGLMSMALAELVSNAIAKQLNERPRPPKHLIPHQAVHNRPDSPSFPSGHTAAAAGFTAATARRWPAAGAMCAVAAAAVAAERVHSGAHYPSDAAAGAVIGLACARLLSSAPAAVRGLARLSHRAAGT
jgi:membrane-associated phospholipid phosphatase